MSIRVVVADDQELVRSGFTMILDAQQDIEVVAEAGDGAEAVAAVQRHTPDVLLLDIRMPVMDGLEAARRVCAQSCCKVVMLTTFDLDEYVYEALYAGASGFLLKDSHPDALLDAIRRTHRGESPFAPKVLTRMIEAYIAQPPRAKPASLDALTARETEVLTLVGHGLSNDEIAARLTISIKTVKTHIGNLLSKLQARDRAHLVIAAYEGDLVHSTR